MDDFKVMMTQKLHRLIHNHMKSHVKMNGGGYRNSQTVGGASTPAIEAKPYDLERVFPKTA